MNGLEAFTYHSNNAFMKKIDTFIKIKETYLHLTVDLTADVWDGDTWNFFEVLSVRGGGQREYKISFQNFAETPNLD